MGRPDRRRGRGEEGEREGKGEGGEGRGGEGRGEGRGRGGEGREGEEGSRYSEDERAAGIQ